MAAITFLAKNQVKLTFTDAESLALEELVVKVAMGKGSKEEIAKFFEESYNRSND